MEHVEGYFKDVRDSNIYYQAWLPEEEVKAAVLIVHGLGEHSGRYGNVVEKLVPHGYALYGFDLYGHGKSDGPREFIKSMADYMDTITHYKAMIKAWQPDKPLFILGHSMGGLLVPHYLLDHAEDFRGAVISAPAILVPPGITKMVVAAGKVLSVLAPKAGVMQLDANGVSKDPEVVRAYVNDPLVFHGKTSARLSAEMLDAMMRVNNEMSEIKLPVIILQGSKDLMADPEGAKKLYQNVSSEDKTLKVYKGLYHEVFNEPERAQVLSDLEGWLDAHL
jgi:acylglycerol lipase